MPQQVTIETPHGVSQSVALSLGADGASLAMMPRFDSRYVQDYARTLLQRAFPEMRSDSGTLAFARQLEHVVQEVFEIEYPALRAAEFIPVYTAVEPGSLTFTYRQVQKHGIAKVITTWSADLPKASLDAKEWQSPIVTIGSSYEFGIVETWRAALANVPLEAMLADAARFAIEFLGEQIACKGLANTGIPGFSNAPGMLATTQVSTGTWLAQIASIGSATPSAPAAAVAVASGIAMDLQAMTSKIQKQTIGLHAATNCLLPTSLWTALMAVPRSPAFTDDTLLDYLEKISGLKFDHWPQLNNAGSGGLGRVMVYEKDPRVCRLVRPLPFTQLPPQPINLAWQVPCLAQEGGVMAVQPLAMTYMDGLD